MNVLQGIVKVVLCKSHSAIEIWLYPAYPSMKVYLVCSPTPSNMVVIHSKYKMIILYVVIQFLVIHAHPDRVIFLLY